MSAYHSQSPRHPVWGTGSSFIPYTQGTEEIARQVGPATVLACVVAATKQASGSRTLLLVQ